MSFVIILYQELNFAKLINEHGLKFRFNILGMIKANLQILTHNATLVVPNQTFSPSATLRALHTERCTALYGVHTCIFYYCKFDYIMYERIIAE